VKRQAVLDLLSAHNAELRALGVASLALFGSLARDEADDRSDVDLLVAFDRPVGLFQFFRVQHYLEELLGVAKVDLVQRTALHPALRDRILEEAIDVA
jgi:predicted nucleotidyltransferase